MKTRNALEDLIEAYVSGKQSEEEVAASNYLIETIKKLLVWGWNDAYKKVGNKEDSPKNSPIKSTKDGKSSESSAHSTPRDKRAGVVSLDDGTDVLLGSNKSKEERKRLARAARKQSSEHSEDGDD